MKHIFSVVISLLILVSCAPVKTPQSLPNTTPTVFNPPSQSTSTPVTVLFSPTYTPVPCDPLNVDFCITEGHFILERPVKPPANASMDLTYPYGSTANGTRDPHHGVEFANKSGTPAFAAADGKVIFAGPDQEAIYSPWANFYGNLVVIEHADELFTLYAHLAGIDVQAHQEVLAGDKIGEIGSTGVAIGSHLHFEVRRREGRDYFASQNPALWLAPNKAENGALLGTLMISIIDQSLDFQYGEFTIDYHIDRNQPRVKSYYGTTYARDMTTGDENAALGDLLPGDYRIALEYNGRHYERWLAVESGKLTRVVIVVI